MKATDDLTAGNISAQLAALALPLIAGNILQQFYNTIDSLIVGRCLGHTAFAAIGVAGSVMNLFLFVLVGACSGISVLFAQLYGQKSWDRLRRESFLSLSFGGLFAAALGVTGILTLNPLLQCIQTPEEVGALAHSYLWIIYLGLPAAFLYNWCAAVLRAAGNTRAALWVLLAAMLLNLGLDVAFVVACGMGISGTAVATVISQLFSAALCLGYMRRKCPELLFRRGDCAFDGGLLRATARLGMASALHQSSLYIGKLLVQGAVNTAGTEIISAYTAAMRIEGFANSFSDSGSAAVSVFVAQNQGAGRTKRVKQGFFRGLRGMILLGVCLAAAMWLTVRPAVLLLMGEASDVVLENAGTYIRIIALLYVVCFVVSTLVGLFRGLGMVHVPLVGTAIQISIRVVFSWLWIARMGLSAAALATGMGWAAFAAYGILLYRVKIRKRWKTEDGGEPPRSPSV